MSSLLNNCADCASLLLQPCEDIIIAAGLTPDTSYWWFITDQFGNVWKQQATTDVNGVLTIYEYFLPTGFLTSGIGTITIEIKLTEDALETVPLTFANVPYDCMQVSFSSVSTQPTGYETAVFGIESDYCVDMGAVLLEPPTPGGTFAGDGVFLWAIADGGDDNYYFDPSTVSLGAHVITYTLGATVYQMTVTVHPLPTVTLDSDAIILDPVTTPLYTMAGGLPTGGIYYVDGIETVILDTNAIAKGTHNVFYSYTDANGCGSGATQTITIQDNVVVTPSPNYVDVICTEYTVETIEYSSGLFFDVYKETCNTNTNRPVFIALHPAAATRTHANPVNWCKDFVSRGWYALSADFGHEVQGVSFTNAKQKKCVANVCALIRYLRANAVALGINSLNIILWGKSAGAVVAASVAAAANDVDANKLLGDPTTGYWYYPINSENPSFSSVPTGSGSESGAINSAIDNYIDAADGDHHFYNGTLDCTVPYSSTCGHGPGALENYNAMLAVGLSPTFIPLLGYAHDITDFHQQILTGGCPVVVGVADLVYANNTFAVDIGIVQKFANLLSP